MEVASNFELKQIKICFTLYNLKVIHFFHCAQPRITKITPSCIELSSAQPQLDISLVMYVN